MKPSAFHDLPVDHFPLVMRFYRLADGQVVHEITVQSAPVAVEIPGLAHEHGPVGVEIRFATGETVGARPPQDTG